MTIFKTNILILFFFSLLYLIACESSNVDIKKEDVSLARVYNKTLYSSDLKKLMPESIDPEDSTLMANAYVEKWVREALLMHEAELNIKKDINIDKLVRDYRSSLIMHNYENHLIKEELDSTITEEQFTTFYEQNKEQYQLKNPILRCHFIKLPLSAADLENCTHWWSSQAEADRNSLAQYCNKHAEVFLLTDKAWYDTDRIIQYFPNGVLTMQNIGLKQNFLYKDQNYQYYLKVLEIVKNNEPPPLEYIKNQAKKVILHQRKNKLLEYKRENLYEEEKNGNNIKIYTQ